MAGRALGEGVLDRHEGGPGGLERHIVGVGRGVGVCVDPDALPGGIGNLVHVLRRVDAHELFGRRGTRYRQHPAAADPSPADLGHHAGARGLLGMTVWCLMVDEMIATDEQHDS